jgi:DNA polymerase-3 subunit alpha
VRTLAGFTRGESDNVRKAMGKKIIKMMEELEIKFVEGCEREKTLSVSEAKDLWEKFKEFAKYAFNKSHAVAYTIVANQCAYLKANFPAEFLAASMSSNMGDSDQLALHLDDATTNFGLEIGPPDINNSESLFAVKDNKIIYALAAIKGAGKAAMDAIVAERNANGRFKNLTDFAKRTTGILNKRILEAFIKVGALDSLGADRAQMFLNMDAILMYAARQKACGNSLSLFADTVEDDVSENRLMRNLPKAHPWDFGEMLKNEHSVLGFYISAHPLDQFKNMIKREKLTTSESLGKKRDRESVQIAASVNSFSRRTTKTGKPMLTISASDSHGNIDAVAFGESVGQIAMVLGTEKLVLISGRVSVRDDSRSLFVDGIQPLSQWIAAVTRKLTLDVDNPRVLPDVKKVLDGFPAGGTKVFIKLTHDGKTATLALPRPVRLSPTIAENLSAIGIKAVMD